MQVNRIIYYVTENNGTKSVTVRYQSIFITEHECFVRMWPTYLTSSSRQHFKVLFTYA